MVVFKNTNNCQSKKGINQVDPHLYKVLLPMLHKASDHFYTVSLYSSSAFSFILKGRREFRFRKPPFQSLTYLTTRVEGDTVSRQPPFPADAPEALARPGEGEGRDGRTVGAGEGGGICNRGGWAGVQMETGDEVAEGHKEGSASGRGTMTQ